ncbi:DUF7284 family protein [Halorubrum trueperi]|uniref:Uncharacterized protein n=1 Tax=Halorubrum trueperi TaxID=2004704 RepID=A0ABD5UEA0_9EURY
MTSTVLDVTVLLLCVSASAVTLGATGSDIGGSEPTAAEVADRLATETVTVTYRSEGAPDRTRTVHATRAEMLAILASERGGGTNASESNDRFGTTVEAAIGNGLGRRTRIDAEAVMTSTNEESATSSDRTADEAFRWATNGAETATRSPSDQGIPWRLDRARGSGSGTNDKDETGSEGEKAIEPVAVGSDPPRNADVTAAVVTQPVSNEIDDVESVRIVVRKW